MSLKIRRVVTGHDEKGKAIALIDAEAGNVISRKAAGLNAALIWFTESAPADISGVDDKAECEIGVAPSPTGSIFRIVEFLPEKEAGKVSSKDEIVKEMGLSAREAGGKSRHPGMHRTESIDYSIILSGEIDLLLDDSDIHLKAGDVVVQRGTNHAWANRGDEPCRIAFVLIGAKQ